MKLPLRRKVGKGAVIRITFVKGRPVLSPEVARISRERGEVARWEVEGGKILRIEFDPKIGSPVTGFDWCEPSKVLSGPASDAAEIGKEYVYSLVVQKARAKEPVLIDPRMIVDP